MRAARLSPSRLQEWFVDTRTPVRRMKVAYHQESGIVVVSLWQGDHCTATFRLPAGDVARLQHFLVDTAVSPTDHGIRSEAGARPSRGISRLLRRSRRAQPWSPAAVTPLRRP